MGIGRRRRATAIGGALLTATTIVALNAGAASGYSSTTPFNHDFGSHQVGTVSAPVTYTLTARCYPDAANPGMCSPGGEEPFTPKVTVTGPFQIQDNGCTAMMPGNTVPGTSCNFKVAFAPFAAGLATGIIDVADPSGFGKAAVKGTGILPPPPPPTTPPASTGAKKKCKKGFRLVKVNGKRKCKRKRR